MSDVVGARRNKSSAPTPFPLAGIPGLEAKGAWLAVPFCSLYAAAFLGNAAILLVVVRVPGLHRPTCYFYLSMLAVAELGMSVSTLPTVASVFLFGAREIGADACLAQMFFIHYFSIMDSGVLWAMALDRLVAIYSPLQYATLLTHPRVALIGLGIAVRSVVVMVPLPLLLRRLPFCRANSLAHAFCLHPDLIRLPCADTTLNSHCGLFVVLSTFGLDSLFIFLSYILIVKTVLGMASREGRLRALNT
ncbi:PREDICTED: olfactory receptor 51I2-like, partial [Gekko japonicus]|uniref:Olfactory receptor 51I2-like n=1 Tax=Gekko japonicus TaxID=146911 RepID=A0ABM1JZV0_GEKJA